MKNVKLVVDYMNVFCRFNDAKAIDARELDVDAVRRIRRYCDSALSPENLFGDGEIPASKARARGKMLQGALDELQAAGW